MAVCVTECSACGLVRMGFRFHATFCPRCGAGRGQFTERWISNPAPETLRQAERENPLRTLIDREMIAPRYRSGNCEAALDAARLIPRLATLVAAWDKTGHGACFNAILDNAVGSDSGPIWIAFHSK